MIIKPFQTMIANTEPNPAAIFALSILSKYHLQLEDYWSFDALVYLMALESEQGQNEQRIREVVEMSPLVLNALKSTIRNETRREIIQQTLPKLLIYIRTHPELTRQPIWIHQHQQILKMIEKQSLRMKEKPHKRVWESGELLPLVSKSELRQSGRRKSIQTLIRLIRSVETYYVDNNGPKAVKKGLHINQYDAKSKEEIIKRLTKLLIKTYGLTPENDPKKNVFRRDVQTQTREVRTKALAYRTNTLLANREKNTGKNSKETFKWAAKYIPKWIHKEADVRLKRSEMTTHHIKQKDIIEKLEVLLHPHIYKKHQLSNRYQGKEVVGDRKRKYGYLNHAYDSGTLQEASPQESARPLEALKLVVRDAKLSTEPEEVQKPQGIRSVDALMALVTKREDVKALLRQYQSLTQKQVAVKQENERSVQHYIETELLPKVSQQSTQVEQIKRMSQQIFEEWKTQMNEKMGEINAPALSNIEKMERSFMSEMGSTRGQAERVATSVVDDAALHQMTDLVINRVVDQVFDKVTQKIDQERRRRGI